MPRLVAVVAAAIVAVLAAVDSGGGSSPSRILRYGQSHTAGIERQCW